MVFCSHPKSAALRVSCGGCSSLRTNVLPDLKTIIGPEITFFPPAALVCGEGAVVDAAGMRMFMVASPIRKSIFRAPRSSRRGRIIPNKNEDFLLHICLPKLRVFLLDSREGFYFAIQLQLKILYPPTTGTNWPWRTKSLSSLALPPAWV